MIYFVRHGATDWNEHKDENGNKKPRCQGIANIPLNSKGIEQANKTKEFLQGIKFDRIITSPLQRAIDTCKILTNNSPKIEIDNRLIERDFGEFEGMTRDQFDFLGFWNSNYTTKFENAESLESVKKRVKSLLDELAKKPNENILLVSHGGLGCVLFSYFKGIPADGNYISFEVPHAKPAILDINDYILNSQNSNELSC